MYDNCLRIADDVVSGNRRNDYGTPLENHSRTARLWTAYLKLEVSAEDVCMLNILQKISRGMHSITPDTLVDICGYARNIQIIREEKLGKSAPSSYERRGVAEPLQVQNTAFQDTKKTRVVSGEGQTEKLTHTNDTSPKSHIGNQNTKSPSGGPVPCCGLGSNCQEVREMSDVQTGWGVPPNWKTTPLVL
jgi:hypothetical protein